MAAEKTQSPEQRLEYLEQRVAALEALVAALEHDRAMHAARLATIEEECLNSWGVADQILPAPDAMAG